MYEGDSSTEDLPFFWGQAGKDFFPFSCAASIFRQVWT